MRRDLRELAVLLVAGVVLGLGHLALRTDLAWFPAPSVEDSVCGAEGSEPPPAASASPAPAASFAPPEPMSSPGPEDVP